jgi:cellulose synthase/poly-beta-1,6-N-acetylglucosamine synthase-like glycosyltransferase
MGAAREHGPGTERVRTRYVRVRSPASFSLLLALYSTLALPYLVWRSTVINWDVWFAPVLYAAEFYGVLSTGLFLWMTRVINLPRHRPARRDSAVDAFICTCNEPLTVLGPTVRGACAVRGIRDVLVLDDGNRPDVRRMANALGARYFARTTNTHAKAGNLNHGLAHSDAEFLLLLDADHVPSPNFLERTLGHLDDPAVAFVQTPQTYHNRDTFLFRLGRRGSWSEQGMFYRCIQPAKNGTNSAFFVGTSAVMRRAALDSIDGFATGTATEDIHTSLRLHARGWRSVFVPEALAYGLEAENLKEFYRQRRRWAAGSLGLLLRSRDSPLCARGLSTVQRLSYLSATLAHAQGPQRMIFFLTPVLCVTTLSAPVTAGLPTFLAIAGGYTALGIFATARFSRGTYHLVYTECYALANAIAQCAALSGVIRVDKKFSVSRKSVQRGESTWVKSLLLGLTALAGAGAVYSAARLALGPPADTAPLLAVCGVMFALTFAMLTNFLLYLRRYERRPALVLPMTSRPAPAPVPARAVIDHALVEAEYVGPSPRRSEILAAPALAAPPGSTV